MGLRLGRSLAEVVAVGLILVMPGCGRQGPTTRPVALDPPAPASDTAAVRELRVAAKGANVVIIVLDAARADHFGCYGYPRGTTPNFDRLAGESFLFEQHFCQYPQTYASTASLLTGLYPDTHLAFGGGRLESGAFALPTALRAAGYLATAFTSTCWLSPDMGLGDRFDLVLDGPTADADETDLDALVAPEVLLRAVSDWFGQRPREPVFAYIHLVPPHQPYRAPPDMQRLFLGQDPPGAWQGDYEFDEVEPLSRRRRAQDTPPLKEWVNLYDSNLRWADWAVGEIEQVLRRVGILDRTLLIITSDHGEAFGEHGYTFHSCGVYDELVRVPLAIKLPGNRHPARIGALTESVDIAPTILDLLRIAYPRDELQGRSLVPLMSGNAEAVHNYVFARATGEPESYVVRSNDMALILYQGARLRALYDLGADPKQTRNIIEQAPERAEELVQAFTAFARTQVRPPLEFIDPNAKPLVISGPKRRLSDKDRRRMRALGYLE